MVTHNQQGGTAMVRQAKGTKSADTVIQPIMVKKKSGASSSNSSNGSNKENGNGDDDGDLKKKQMTPIGTRRRQTLRCLLTLLCMVLVLLTSRGYHRRHHNELKRHQKREWMRFIRRRKKNQDDNDKKKPAVGRNEKARNDDSYQNMDTYLQANPKVAHQWEKHLESHQDIAQHFEEHVDHEEDYWKPNNDPLEMTADGLGSAAETIGEWFHDTAEPFLGKDVTDSLGNVAHDTLDQVGDWTDELEKLDLNVDLDQATETVQSGLQGLFDAANTLWNATADTVTDWMDANTTAATLAESVEEWSDWTANFVKANAPSFLWNYTLVEEAAEEDGMADDDNDEPAPDVEEEEDVADGDDVDKGKKKGDEGTDIQREAARKKTDSTDQAAAQKPGGFGKKKQSEQFPIKPLPEFLQSQKNKKKSKRFAFITTGFPGQKDLEWRLESYVLGALNTYLQDSVLFYIINTVAKNSVERICALPHNQEACQRLLPLYVNCPARDYGIATCCHQDKGLSLLAKAYPEQFEQFDWYVFHQDDLYFRLDYMTDFVKGLPNPHKEALLLSASPLRPLGHVLAHQLDKKEVAPKTASYGCSSSPNHIYPWGRPALVYSHAALHALVPAYERLAISKECNAFQVPAAAASPIVHWMHQLPLVKMPMIASATPKEIEKALLPQPQQRALPPSPNNNSTTSSAPRIRLSMAHRYLALRADVTRHNFTDLHKAVLASKKAAKSVKGATDNTDDSKNNNDKAPLYPPPPYKYNFHRPTGFTETTIYKEHGAVKSWTTTATTDNDDNDAGKKKRQNKWVVFSPEHCIKANTTMQSNMINVNGKFVVPPAKQDSTKNPHLRGQALSDVLKKRDPKAAEAREARVKAMQSQPQQPSPKHLTQRDKVAN